MLSRFRKSEASAYALNFKETSVAKLVFQLCTHELNDWNLTTFSDICVAFSITRMLEIQYIYDNPIFTPETCHQSICRYFDLLPNETGVAWNCLHITAGILNANRTKISD